MLLCFQMFNTLETRLTTAHIETFMSNRDKIEKQTDFRVNEAEIHFNS